VGRIWTPGGEYPVGDPRDGEPDESGIEFGDDLDDDLDPELVQQMQAQMDAAREQLASTPAKVIVTNHAMGLYELAAIHLTASPPAIDEARLAIDAFGLLVQGLEGRLAEEATLREALQSLQFAFVEVSRAAGGTDE